MSLRPRPTEAEFDELKRKRDESITAAHLAICAQEGWDPAKVKAHVSHAGDCYCGCPDGPCQHIWDGAQYVNEDRLLSSATCSRCGDVAFFHDMRCGP